MKKRISLLLLAAGLCTLILQSCTKDIQNLDSDTKATEDHAFAETVFNDIYSVMDDATRQHPGLYKTQTTMAVLSGCETVTVDSVSNPKTLTVDFGTACKGNDGKIRSGKVLVTLNGKYHDAGTVVTISLSNFTVINPNDPFVYKVEGTNTITNNGPNSEGHPVHSLVVKDAKITTADGTITWNATHTREWIDGYATPFVVSDDSYLISGNANGTSADGTTFNVTTTTPLKVKAGCRWIESGVLNITAASKEARVINFGNGDCDDAAVVTISGHDFTIHMR